METTWFPSPFLLCSQLHAVTPNLPRHQKTWHPSFLSSDITSSPGNVSPALPFMEPSLYQAVDVPTQMSGHDHFLQCSLNAFLFPFPNAKGEMKVARTRYYG